MSDSLQAERPRRIWLCADDYGISPGVSRAIRDLVTLQRLNATSVMVLAPSFDRSEAVALSTLNAGTPRVAIGLHLTLTAPFQPLSSAFKPQRQAAFPPLDQMLLRGTLRALRQHHLAAEVAAQLKAFVAAFGRPPDFIDGHQHVHLFPQVRDVVLRAARELAPGAWVRQCGTAAPMRLALSNRKALLLNRLSGTFRSRAANLGVATNPAFAGAYEFNAPGADFSALFPRFLDGLPHNALVMCHPGFVDPELERLDPLTTQREREYAYLSGDAFIAALRERALTLA